MCTRRSISITVSAVVLAASLAALSGCTPGGTLERILRPNTVAARAAIETQRAELDAERASLETTIGDAITAQQDVVRALAEQRIDLQRGYDTAGVNYRADVALLDGRAAAAAQDAKDAADAYTAQIQTLARQRAAAQAQWDQQLAQAEAGDNLIAGLVGAGLTLVPGGAGLAAMLRVLRKRGIETIDARAEGEFIGHEEGLLRGAGAVRDSIAAARAADDAFDRFFEGDTAAARTMREVLARIPEVEAIVKANGRHRPVSVAQRNETGANAEAHGSGSLTEAHGSGSVGLGDRPVGLGDGPVGSGEAGG